jgi:hypothetical protein
MAFMVTSLWGLYVGQSFHTVGKPASDNDGVKAVLTQGEGVAEVIESGGRRYLYGFTSLGELPSKTDLHLNLRIPAEVALADRHLGPKAQSDRPDMCRSVGARRLVKECALKQKSL